MPRTYGWAAQIAVGQRGVEVVAGYLREHGYIVEDVTGDRDYQQQDIDLRVRGKRGQRWKTVEVKTDTYETGNIYLELKGSSGKPGCIFKSRAMVWAYWLSSLGILLLIDLPALQLWCSEHASEYKRSAVMSARGRGRWGVEGVAVPWAELHKSGIAHPVILRESEEVECISGLTETQVA